MWEKRKRGETWQRSGNEGNGGHEWRTIMNFFVILSYRLYRRTEILLDSHDRGKRNEYVQAKEGGKEEKAGSNVNGLLCLWARGAIASVGNHITGGKKGLAESSNETVFSLCVFLGSVTVSEQSHTQTCLGLWYPYMYITIGNTVRHRGEMHLAAPSSCCFLIRNAAGEYK